MAPYRTAYGPTSERGGGVTECGCLKLKKKFSAKTNQFGSC